MDAQTTILQISAIAVTAVSGVCAIVALIAGSPLEFGVAMALGAGWLIAADFIDSSVGQQRADRRRTDPYRVVVVGGQHPARPVSRRTAIPHH